MAEYIVRGADGNRYKITAPSNLSEYEIKAYAQSQMGPMSVQEEEDDGPGFFGAVGNAFARMGGRARGLVDAYQAEQFATIADGQEKQAQIDAERAETGEEPGLLEKILTYRPSFAQPLETTDELRGLAAENVRQQALRNQDFAQRYPMSEGAERGAEIINQETFADVGKFALNNPLDVLSFAGQVGLEQAPTLGAAIVGSAVTRNPNVGMTIMGSSTFAQERFGQMAETAQKYGYDLTNAEDAKKAVANQAFMQEQADRGFTRGAVIAAIDVATLGIGSKLPVNKSGLAGNFGLQVGGGASGEAAGQYLTDGEITSPGDVFVEGLAEGVTLPLEVGIMVAGNRSGVDVDVETANALAQEEAALAAETQQETTDNQQKVGLARVQAAREFIPFPTFKNQKTEEQISDVVKSDDFLSWVASTRTADKPYPQTDKEFEKEAKAYIKENTPAGASQALFEEYNALLDEHSAFKAEASQRTPKAQEQADKLVTNLLQQRVDARAAGDANAEAKVEATAASMLTPGEWRFAKFKADGVIKDKTPKKEAPKKPVAPEAGEQPNVEINLVETSEVQAVDPMTIPVRRRTDAIKQVEALVEDGSLPSNWTEQNDDLNSAINGQRFNIKKYKEALDKTINPVEEAETTAEEAADAEPEVEPVKVEEVTKIKGLSKNQQKIYDVLVDHFVGDKKFEIDEVYAGGQFQTTKIAELAGVESKQAVSTTINRFKTKFLEQQGNLEKSATKKQKDEAFVKFADALATQPKPNETTAQPEQTTDEFADTEDAVDQQPDADEVTDDDTVSNSVFQQQGMGTVASVGQGAYTGVTKEDKEFTQARAEEKDNYANKRQELADRERQIQQVSLVKAYGQTAMNMWRNTATDGAVKPTQLSKADLMDWIGSVQEFEEGIIDESTLSQDQREIEQKYETAPPSEVTDETTTETTEETDDAGQDTRVVESAEGGDTVEQVGTTDTPTSSAEFEQSAAKVTVEKKGRKRKPKVKLSLDETETAAKGTSVEGVKEAARWFIGSDINWRTSVVNSPDDLIGLVLNKEVDISGETLGTILDKGNAQGAVLTDRNGTTRAFFFTDNITPGTERAVVAHELGGHIGMDQVLTGEQLNKAATKINNWANSEGTSLEKIISERALSRVSSAVEQDANTDTESETIAYFLEEAVKAGVTPNSESKSDLVSFIRQIWSDFKRALRKLRPANDAALSAQDLVSVARGAARLELVTDFHGSTNAFRSVQQDFLGLGNNAFGVGFYVSEDQETGTTYMVTRMDEQRSVMGGALQRVDITLAENEFLLWDKNLSAQPNVLDAVKKMPSEMQSDLRREMGDTPLENLSGRQLYIGLTALQLRSYKIENSVSDAAYDQANKLPRDGATAMSIVSSYLDSLGLKGIKYVNVAASDFQRGSYNKVVFNADNAIVVGSNEAQDVDPTTTTPGSVRFSVPDSETNNQIEHTRKNFGDGAAEFLNNLGKVARRPIRATKNLDRIIRENEQKMPSARKWYDVMLQAQSTANDVLSMVEGVINQSRRINRERKVLVNDFIGSSTFFQKWGYDPQWTDPKTNQNIQVTIDPIMKQKYDRLNSEEQQLVRDVFAHGRKMQLMMREIADNLGVSKFFKLDSSLTGPYAPLKRFGKYVGELKSQELLDAEAALSAEKTAANRKKIEELKTNSDHYVISFFESEGAADTFANANREKYAYAEASEKAVDYEDSRPGGAQAYNKIMGAVNANLAGLDQDSKNAMTKMVRDMYFQTLDDSNARLSGTKRLNRAGYDKDMIRAFAEHGMSQANLVAQMKHGAEISSALIEARKQAGSNPSKLMPVYNQVALKFQRMMSPRSGMFADIESTVMKFNSFYMLTSSMGYFFQNMTQPYFAVANVAGEFGYTKQPAAWGKLFSGYNVARKVINTGFLNQVKNVASMGLLGGNSTVELNIDQAPPELRPVLQELAARGLLDVGIAEDLRHVNMSPNILARGYDELTHRLYQSARYVEATNRIASAVAAFRMAQSNPQKMKRLKMTPAEYAVQIVQDTQGNFSQMDAPAAFDLLPKTPLQFRKYQFQMAWLHIDAAKQALAGADPETKKAGFRKLSLMMGYTGVFGGLVSVPMANVATSIAQAVIGQLEGDDEENPDKGLERWIRENVEDERTATLLSRGVPAALGWDFSQKLDQSDLFMPYNSKYVEFDPSRNGALLFAAQLFLGPTGTQVGNVGNIADFVERGNYYRAAEYMMPKGLRSYFETLRFADKGYETRSGLTITDPTSFDVGDFLSNAIGLPSTEINQIKWKRGQQIEIEQWFTGEATRIKRQYLAAYEARDKADMKDLREQFRELQKAKDRVRPFFNNNRNVLKRLPLTDLIRHPLNKRREQRRLDRTTGR